MGSHSDKYITVSPRLCRGFLELRTVHEPLARQSRGLTSVVNIKNLIDDVQCYQTVRELRWPDGVACPSCVSQEVMKRGFDDTEPARQRYTCHNCNQRFDDLTDTIFAGHHQPLKVWVYYGDCSKDTGFIQPVHDGVRRGCVDGLRRKLHAT